MQRFRISAIISHTSKSQECHNVLLMIPHARRCLSTSSCLFGKAVRRPGKPRVVQKIAGVDLITYADRMHFVPGLARPVFPEWQREKKDPFYSKGPKYEEMELYKDKPCYIFTQNNNIVEGVRQALWLSKSVLTNGIPDQVLSLGEDPANQIENQDERVQDIIRNSRIWDTTEFMAPRERFCPNLLHRLLHLCGNLQTQHPELAKRMLAEKYDVAATWSRGEDLFQVRGQNGMLLSSATPIPVVAGPEEIRKTVDQDLETFFPIAPTIDLHCAHVYREKNDTGFRDDYPYPHAHTVFLMEPAGKAGKLRHFREQIGAKMIMFSFANALARAKALYGDEPQVLEKPIVVQSVCTDGQNFHFMLFQLNTTDLQTDSGVKNQVWLDFDQMLYGFARSTPLLKKKVITIPAGVTGYKPESFKKFLSLYLHGAK
ncbi:hypothetical protein DNTS_007080 [Danionella cerebrum]|uniref:Large ribosomal subunit protein mL37 n=1 Tax=Danionella cerebrum TaxID=2873325 RepID=A0A553QC56_9TELE|nr:hypothetical protein DNTS_007080 [Danionella translucida]